MNDKYAGHYSESSFWQKAKGSLKSAGREVLEKSLWLFYALQKESTPAWAKAAIIGALGYFISPIDAIPDFVPVAGFTDDLGVLVAAVGAVAAHIDGGVKALATKKLADWDV
jgi:uncharacterized membrane protein YkvA (DUF1232 family)